MKAFFLYISIIMLALGSCAQNKKVTVNNQNGNSEAVAFPGAEGFGKYTTGGRGGNVFIVTNLNDKGEGSFRAAAEAKQKRMVVFAVSGTIHLETPLSIKGDVTIAGQTAPGDGICIADRPVSLGGDNIIIRYMRFRMGDKYQKGGMVDGNGGDDAFGGMKRKHIIIDHCSLSWSTDEVLSVYNGDSTTIQWNIIAEPLNYSYHFETGDKDYEQHGYGGIWGGQHLSAHHNLFADCNSRNPRFNGIRQGIPELVDYCNNVIYNWGENNIYAGEGGRYNIINNYFKSGPSTRKNVVYRIANPWRNDKIPFGQWYVNGNEVEGAPDVSSNNYTGVHMGNNATEEEKKTAVVSAPHPAINISMQKAKDAYSSVLKYAGASFKRDTMDARIVKDVVTNKGKFVDVQGGYAHGTVYEQTLNAWPALQSLPAPVDTDKDGMPDDWEVKKGLNANDANDADDYRLNQHYTNIEIYINSLIK
ncbi:MAG: pectate lyase [Lacibacter sp.]